MPKILYIHPLGIPERKFPTIVDIFRKIINSVKRPDTKVDVIHLSNELENLEYHYYEHQAIDELLQKVIEAEKEGYDAVIIGCFYDTALRVAREIVNIPVIGPAEATMHYAATLGHRFSIIVGKKKWIAKMEDNAIMYGLNDRIVSWKSIGMGVVDFKKYPDKMKKAIADKAREAVEEDNAEVIIQGCTCESGFMKELIEELNIPVLDSVVCSVKWAEMAADLYRKIGLTHSKVYGYEEPPDLEK